MNIQTIETAVEHLTQADLAKFRRWFFEFDEPHWSTQIETDAASGRLDALAQEALKEFSAGKAKQL
jgi:hypothetical protein